MKSEEFVSALKLVIAEQGCEDLIDLLEDPPGRSPRKENVENSHWYNSLAPSNQDYVKRIILEALDLSVFQMLCVLDHVTFLDDSEEKTTWKLYAIKDEETHLINNPDDEELHNLYNSLPD